MAPWDNIDWVIFALDLYVHIWAGHIIFALKRKGKLNKNTRVIVVTGTGLVSSLVHVYIYGHSTLKQPRDTKLHDFTFENLKSVHSVITILMLLL